MENIMSVSALITIIGVLVAIVNIVTEVIKKATWDKIPTNILVVILSVGLTLIAFFAYAQITGFAVLWYLVVAAVVVGVMVAYAAMFGFDKLKEILQGLEISKDE